MDQHPTIAAPRAVERDWMSLARWRGMHRAQLDHPGRTDADLVLLGDSLVEAWCDAPGFVAAFGSRHPLNLGIGGDQTQNVLWRIEQGALRDLTPTDLVLLIGINNVGGAGHPPAATLDGIGAVIEAVKATLPTTTITVLHLLPAGGTLDDPLRHAVDAMNAGLPAVAERNGVRLVDIGAGLVEPDGTIAEATMPDGIHPTEATYDRLTPRLAAALANPATD